MFPDAELWIEMLNPKNRLMLISGDMAKGQFSLDKPSHKGQKDTNTQ